MSVSWLEGTDLATTEYVDDAAALLAPRLSPTFTGTPRAPTQAVGDNSTKVATTAYADAAVVAVGGRWRGAWAAATDYKAKDLVVNKGGVYAAKVNFTSAGTFNSANWDFQFWIAAAGSYRSGQWIAQRGSTATGSLTLNEVRYTKFRAESSFTIADLAIDLVTPGAAGAVLRLGVYADDGSDGPGALVVAAPGVIDATAAAGQKQQSAGTGGAAMSTPLTPGVYWLATACQGATCQVRCVNGNVVDPVCDSLSSVMANTDAGRVQSGVSGALPATATPGGTQSFVPKVALKIA